MKYEDFSKAYELNSLIRKKESEIVVLKNGMIRVRENMKMSDTKEVFDIKLCKDQLLTIANYNLNILESELKILKNEFKNI